MHKKLQQNLQPCLFEKLTRESVYEEILSKINLIVDIVKGVHFYIFNAFKFTGIFMYSLYNYNKLHVYCYTYVKAANLFEFQVKHEAHGPLGFFPMNMLNCLLRCKRYLIGLKVLFEV